MLNGSLVDVVTAVQFWICLVGRQLSAESPTRFHYLLLTLPPTKNDWCIVGKKTTLTPPTTSKLPARSSKFRTYWFVCAKRTNLIGGIDTRLISVRDISQQSKRRLVRFRFHCYRPILMTQRFTTSTCKRWLFASESISIRLSPYVFPFRSRWRVELACSLPTTTAAVLSRLEITISCLLQGWSLHKSSRSKSVVSKWFGSALKSRPTKQEKFIAFYH